ncbi:MAG TPA: ribonucleotide reductase subunit alpha [Rubrivivax sp.]|nr:ribonucleotide reductase subunit alpha [Rubrivivax sp.]
MNSTPVFDQLLKAAAEQSQPQRLLFVFAGADLPDDATPAQRQNFTAGRGGTLTPLMCVDKAPSELASFDALLEESAHAGPPWQLLFAAALAGKADHAPTADAVSQALHRMVEWVRSGSLQHLIAIDRSGNALEFV